MSDARREAARRLPQPDAPAAPSPGPLRRRPPMHGRAMHGRARLIAAALGLCSIPLASAAPQEGLRAVITEEQALQRAETESQARIDALADEGDELLVEYRFVLEQTEDLRVYNRQLADMVAALETRLAGFEERLAQAEQTQRGVAPLLERMLEVLQRFRSADLPFLVEERTQRLADLRRTLDDPAQPIGEKFRRIFEAYQVEMEYGRTIETWRAKVEHEGREFVVDLLRIGRLSLYFATLDGRTGARWDASAGQWLALQASGLRRLQRALRVARKELPPEFIALPVATP